MRFLRVLVNAMFCIFLVIVIMLAQTLVFDIISLQSPEVDPILPIGSDGTPGNSDGQIGVLDLFALQGTDIKVNLKQPAKYRVRTWFGVNWWYNGTGWLDKTIDVIAGATKPLVVPIAQVNAIKDYTGRTMADFINDDELFNRLLTYGRFGNNQADLLGRIYHYYSVIRPQELTPEIYDAIVAKEAEIGATIVDKQYDEIKYIQNQSQKKIDAFLLDAETIVFNFGTEEEPDIKTLRDIIYDVNAVRALDATEYKDTLTKIRYFWTEICPRDLSQEMYDVLVEKGTSSESYDSITKIPNADSETYGHWVRQKYNDIVYETVWKLSKYNATNGDGVSYYAKYLNKFVSISDSGERHLKPTVLVLCLTFYVSIILAVIFVIKYPIALAQGRWEGRRRRKEDGVDL